MTRKAGQEQPAGSKLYRKHRAAIESGTIGKAFVRGMKAALNAADRRARGYDTSSTAPKISAAELAILQNLLSVRSPRVDDAMTRQGWEWLGKRPQMKIFSQRERDIIANFSHYTCVGFFNAGNIHAGFYIPMWRVHAKDGAAFTYRTGSWQSGIPLTIMD